MSKDDETRKQFSASAQTYRLEHIEPHSAGVLVVCLSIVGFLALVGYALIDAVKRGSVGNLFATIGYGAVVFVFVGYLAGSMWAWLFNWYGRMSGGLSVRLRAAGTETATGDTAGEPSEAEGTTGAPQDLLAAATPTSEKKHCPVCKHRVSVNRSFCPECDHSFE